MQTDDRALFARERWVPPERSMRLANVVVDFGVVTFGRVTMIIGSGRQGKGEIGMRAKQKTTREESRSLGLGAGVQESTQYYSNPRPVGRARNSSKAIGRGASMSWMLGPRRCVCQGGFWC